MTPKIFRRIAGALAFAAAACPAFARDHVIAVVAPLTGPAAIYGTQLEAGAQAFFARLNKAGGIRGVPVKLIVEDDKYRTDLTSQFVKRLIEQQRPLAFIAGAGAANWDAVAKSDLLQQSETAAVGLVIPSSFMREPQYRNFFFLRPTFREEVARIVSQLKETGHRRVAILYQDDAAGHDALAGFEAAAKQAGMKAQIQASYGRDASKVQGAMAQILAVRPDSIILLANSAAAGAAVKLARSQGFKGQMIGTSMIDPASIVKVAGNDLTRGLGLIQVMPNPLDRTRRVSIEFREAMSAWMPGAASFSPVAMEGYLAAKVAAAAISAAGPNPRPRDVYRELTRLKALDLGGFWVTFGEQNRTGSSYSALAVIDWSGRLLY
jgi:ABC-type branched-subunit amino acid transport system substrate-binding protein